MRVRWPLPIPFSQLGAVLQQLSRSAVVWSWVFNGLRLASGLLLLPLVLKKLSTEELGMYYVLLSQVALAPVIDFGFSPAVLRFVSYAMGGAETLQAHGVTKSSGTGPNYRLLWHLFFTTRALYRVLALLVLVVLGVWGTYIVELRIHETPSPFAVQVAWGVTLLATVLDVYSSWAPVFLRGMDQVLVSVRITVWACVVRYVLAAALLLAGAGLLSLPVASFVSSLLQQFLARRACLGLLAGQPRPERVEVWQNLRTIWPNSWRQGLQNVSSYLTTNANTTICLSVLGLAANAQYGLSVQLLGIITGMASVWTHVKWQVISQQRAQHDFVGIQRTYWSRMWLQYLTFLLMAAGLLVCGQPLLRWLGSGKQMMAPPWMLLLTVNAFLEMQVGTWGTLIATGNRIPYLWPAIASNVVCFVLSLTLIHTTSLGLGAFVLSPLLAQGLFNYWYWPGYAARSIGTSWGRFMFFGPSASISLEAPEPAETT